MSLCLRQRIREYFEQRFAGKNCVPVMMLKEPSDLLPCRPFGVPFLRQRWEAVDFALHHPALQLAFDDSADQKGEEINEHQRFDALVAFKKNRRDV